MWECDRLLYPRHVVAQFGAARRANRFVYRLQWPKLLWVNSGRPMGRYIDEILQPGERVLYSTNEHWMFFLPAIAAWIVAVVFLVLWRLVTADALMLVCLALAVVAGLAALYWTATAWLHRWTNETDVTNMRVVHKTGFIKRRTFEMSLDKVESVDVNQSILGRLMNYGNITIQGVGEGTQTISTIASPLAFRNAITTRPVSTQITAGSPG